MFVCRKKVSSEFLEIQDSYLQEEINGKGITDIGELEPIKKEFMFGKEILQL